MCVCVSVRSFLPSRASRPRNIGTYVFTATRKTLLYIIIMIFESIIWCVWIVCCPEFGGCPLLGSSKCIESMGIAVGASTVIHYTVDVCYWECTLTKDCIEQVLKNLTACGHNIGV